VKRPVTTLGAVTAILMAFWTASGGALAVSPEYSQKTVLRLHHHASFRGSHAIQPIPFRRLPRHIPFYRGPGYIFVPGRGIIDDACNLPTSGCYNEQRDVQ
jgi:hypothetical protein